MIKIELNSEKREKIEELFLEELVGGYPNGTRGWLIDCLDTKSCRDLLRSDNRSLHDYLYDGAGKPDIKNIKSLLLANRAEMEKFINRFGIYPGRTRKKQQPPPSPQPRTRAKELLKTAFCYTRFSTQDVVNKILWEMDVPVCPYCNRLYITVLKRKRVRPQLDHFFPKLRYPYLALCLYNLIPSCGVCNQAKSDLDPMQETPILYPYEEEFGKEIVFALDLKDRTDFVQKIRGDSGKIQVRINNPEPLSDFGRKVNQQDTKLHLTDLYNQHGAYIADILRSYHVNTEARVTELLQRFPDLFSSRDEILSLMFMSCLEKSRWKERPLAKLTHDICCELETLSV